jgi:hypothetical protein
VIETLAVVITIAALACAVTIGVSGGGGRFRGAVFLPTLALLEIAVLIQALIDLISLARGHRLESVAVHLAYLIVSVALVPVAVQAAGDDGTWSAVLLVVALVFLAVVVRMQTTWRTADG